MQQTPEQANQTEQSQKKPYHRPHLRIYGSIQELTQTIATGSGGDVGGYS
jgi:hypothetical protein